jgi:hypothetical protein
LPSFSSREEKKEPEREREVPTRIAHSLLSIPVIIPAKTEKVESVFGKKVLEDLRNEKEWKVRLEAI